MSLTEYMSLDDFLLEAAYQEVASHIRNQNEAQQKVLQDMTKQIEIMKEKQVTPPRPSYPRYS